MNRAIVSAFMVALGIALPGAQATPPDAKVETLDLAVRDAGRSRTIPVLIYLPAEKKAAPVVLFSHGLGGDRTGSAYFGQHLARRGYVGVFLQHPGSDDSVWKDNRGSVCSPLFQLEGNTNWCCLRGNIRHSPIATFLVIVLSGTPIITAPSITSARHFWMRG